MQENFLHFLSSTPCQININGKNIGFIDNINILEIDILTKTNKIFVSYNPISSNISAIPYTFEINTSSSPMTENEYIKIIPFPNNQYDIIMTPFYYYQIDKSKVLLNKELGKYYVSIVTDNITHVNIFSGASIVFTINIPKFISAKATLENEIICIEGVIDNETYYLLVINTKDFSVLHNDISHSIENSDEIIESLKKIKDISHHCIIYQIKKAEKTCQNYKAYEDNICREPHSALHIPKVFLEAIKLHDEKIIKNYLSPQLQSTPIEKFLTYFGEIKEIYLNRHNVLQDKFNYTIFCNKYKNYNFIMQNNKIIDIEEIF